MLHRTLLFTLSALIACSGDKTDEGSDSGGQDDTQDEVSPIDFVLNYTDGVTGLPLVGAEVCVLEPELDGEDCYTTNEDGSAEWTWAEPFETNVLHRLTLGDYFTTLYTGRYDDALGELWEEFFEETGVVELNYFTWSENVANATLQMAGTAYEDGMGHVFYALVSQDGSPMSGATAALTNEAGEAVGELLYINAHGAGFDTTLESTSTSGGVAFINVEPGTHTLTLTSGDFSCTPGFAWHSDVDNVVTLPTEADTITGGTLACSAS